MKSKPTLFRILFGSILVLLWMSWIQYLFEPFQIEKLRGDVKFASDKEFKFSSWFSGDYQPEKEKYLNDHFGFRSTCIRINNQIDYSIYKKANAKNVLVGKNHMLYEKHYITNYFGNNFKGEEYHENLLNKIALLSDTLQKMDKMLLVVIAPGKGSFYPEFIPDSLTRKRSTSNYDSFIRQSKKYPLLNLIDFRSYFIAQKSISPHPLYPKYGIHWSTYGASLAADSILGYMESIRNIKLRRLKIASIEMKEASGVDYDIGDGMNLLFRAGSDLLAYPEYESVAPAGFSKPNMIVISDSYYWNFYNSGFSYSFKNSSFWYYNKEIHSNIQNSPESPSLEYTKDAIYNSEIIMLLVTEAMVDDIGWGFLDAADQIFHLSSSKSGTGFVSAEGLAKVIEIIMANQEWVNTIREKAQKQNMSFEEVLQNDAKWTLEQQLLK